VPWPHGFGQGECRSRVRWRRREGAFTLAEVLVAIAVLMILIGLLLPPLAVTRVEARRTAAASQLRQCTALVSLYCDDHREAFPIGHERAFWAGWRWTIPILAGGYAASQFDLDGAPARDDGEPRFAISRAMVCSPEIMIPGQTVDINLAPSSVIRRSAMAHPSAKGVMWQWWIDYGRVQGFWCCQPSRLVGPVSMGDGSLIVDDWTRFHPSGAPLTIENDFGWPVNATWLGIRGRDLGAAAFP